MTTGRINQVTTACQTSWPPCAPKGDGEALCSCNVRSPERSRSPEGPTRSDPQRSPGGFCFPSQWPTGHATRRSQRPRRGARTPSVPFGSSGGRLVPCCSVGPKVFQWSAEPNPPVTQRSRWRFPSTPCLKPVSWGLIGGSSSSRAGAYGACYSHRDGNHSLIDQIWYCDSGSSGGPQRV